MCIIFSFQQQPLPLQPLQLPPLHQRRQLLQQRRLLQQLVSLSVCPIKKDPNEETPSAHV